MANIVTRRDRPAHSPQRFAEWDPFERMRELMQWDLFQDLPRRWLGQDPMASFAPRFDVREENDAFSIKADLPGIKEADLDLSITGNHLTISGKREEEQVDEAESYYCRERSYGSFSRSFTLPENVDADNIHASMQAGVLDLKIPKRAESQPKKIPVQTSSGGNGGSSSPEERASSSSEGAPSPSGAHSESRTPAGEAL